MELFLWARERIRSLEVEIFFLVTLSYPRIRSLEVEKIVFFSCAVLLCGTIVQRIPLISRQLLYKCIYNRYMPLTGKKKKHASVIVHVF